MEQYIVTSTTKELVYLKRVDKEYPSELILNKKFLRKLLKNGNNPNHITCEQLVSIEYSSEDSVEPISFNGILKFNTND